MDFIAKYGSSPVDRKRYAAVDAAGGVAEVRLTDPEPVAYVFKTAAEAHFGELSFFRVYSGSLKAGMELYNSDRQITERIGQIYLLNGRDRATADELSGGDIGAVVKLKDTHTGNTLCSAARPVKLAKVQYPHPTIHASLQVTAKGEEDKVAAGMAALHEEDPTFVYRVDSELHQTIISAQGELHLEVVVDRLRRRFNVHVELGEPRVPFRETIKPPGRFQLPPQKADRRRGPVRRGLDAHRAAARAIPAWNSPNPSPARTWTASLSPPSSKAWQNACREGILAGYKVVDVKIDFYDGKMHPVDSKDIAFQIAGYFAFKESFMKARPCLLEPIHHIEVRIPEDCLGKVMGDISSRRGRILGIDTDGHFQVIRAEVPARELYKYSSVLRSLTAGRSLHSEHLDHYSGNAPRTGAARHRRSQKAQSRRPGEIDQVCRPISLTLPSRRRNQERMGIFLRGSLSGFCRTAPSLPAFSFST